MNSKDSKFDELVNSIGQLMQIEEAENEHFAAGLYRAMFRHETNLNKLDNEYGDHILGYASCGCSAAEEDYRNYMQYVKTIRPAEYPEYVRLYESMMSETEEDEG